jgi:hypothetical protein
MTNLSLRFKSRVLSLLINSWAQVACGILLTGHGISAWVAAKNQSVVWDEITIPAAGLVQWKTGEIGINQQHPFLSKLICSAPLMLTSAQIPFDHLSWKARDSYRFGYEFTFRNTLPPRQIIETTRFTMIMISILTGLILCLCVGALWGPVGGLGALVCYVCTPIIAARSSLALLEMPQYFFLTMTVAFWGGWIRTSRKIFFWTSSLSAGLAVACKSSSAVVLAALFMIELFRTAQEYSLKNRINNAFVWGLGAGGFFCLLYLLWSNGIHSLMTALTFPFTFGKNHNQYYFYGVTLMDPPAFLTWGSMLLKAPPFVVSLSAIGAWAWYDSRKERMFFVSIVVVMGTLFLSVFLMRTALSTVQISAVYLLLAVLAGGIGARRWGRLGRLGLILLALGAVSDMAWSRANPLAYFNFFVGGKNQGYRWLADSDQDWGQWLPQLKSYWDKQGRPGLLLAYSGASDPSAYGLVFQDLVSSALYVREARETEISIKENRVLLAVGTKMLQSEPRLFAWLQNNLTPIAQPDPCFFVYDLTGNAEAFRWVAALYSITKRPHRAQWALAYAQKGEN